MGRDDEARDAGHVPFGVPRLASTGAPEVPGADLPFFSSRYPITITALEFECAR